MSDGGRSRPPSGQDRVLKLPGNGLIGSRLKLTWREDLDQVPLAEGIPWILEIAAQFLRVKQHWLAVLGIPA